MKKYIFIVMILLGLGLIISGCGKIMNVSVPKIEMGRNATVFECDNNYAATVIDFYQGMEIDGVNEVDVDRSYTSNATGAVDGNFFSLGFPVLGEEQHGWIILDFGKMVGGCINLIETSPAVGGYNGGNYPYERAEVYVNDDLSHDWVYKGIAENNINSEGTTHQNVFMLDECIRYVKIVDITDPTLFAQNHTHDAFDVNAVYAGLCIEVPLDIKPNSCPNPLNTKSNGVIPVAILGTEEFDVNNIDPATVELAGVLPLGWAWEDVATPFEPYSGKTDCENDCNTLGPDGFLDLTLKFDTQELLNVFRVESFEVSEEELNALESGESEQVTTTNGDILEDGACLVIQLEGLLFDGTPIMGEDVVRILKKGK